MSMLYYCNLCWPLMRDWPQCPSWYTQVTQGSHMLNSDLTCKRRYIEKGALDKKRPPPPLECLGLWYAYCLYLYIQQSIDIPNTLPIVWLLHDIFEEWGGGGIRLQYLYIIKLYIRHGGCRSIFIFFRTDCRKAS